MRTVRQKRDWLFVLLLLAMASAPMVAAFAVGGAMIAHSVWIVLAALVTFGLVGGLAYAWNRLPSLRERDVRLDEHGLWLDGRLARKRSAIRHAQIEDGWLKLHGRLRKIEIAAPDDGEALLAAMRLGPGQSVARFDMQHGSFGWSVKLAAVVTLLQAAMLSLLAFIGLWALAPVCVIALATMAWGLWAITRVEVGADGVQLRGRFVPFHAIDRIFEEGRDVVFVLRDGERLVVHHTGARKESKLALVETDVRAALVARVNARLAEQRPRDDQGTALLARGGRPTKEWLRDVAKQREVGYRDSALPPEALWRVVEDVAADATARAGAAYALRDSLDATGRARLEALADACAAPKLRVALEEIAEGTEDLEPAFEALGEAPRAMRLPAR